MLSWAPTHHIYLGWVSGQRVSMFLLVLDVSEKEEGVVALHLPIGSSKTCCGLESVPRCEPSTYRSITDNLATEPPMNLVLLVRIYYDLCTW